MKHCKKNFKMFELEDYSTGFHDGYIHKYADSNNSMLDFYISDSMQDMLDIDIRSEIATVVNGGNSENGLGTLGSELPSLDNAIEALSAINNNSSNNNHVQGQQSFSSNTTSCSSNWFSGSNGIQGPSWSSTNDFYADVGACVNPASVMPLITSSMIHATATVSPKPNLNSASVRATTLPAPPSPTVNETKSHLTFSPAQVKVPAGSLRNEQIYSHIPKQIVSISSSVTSATTAPATLATNSVLQRRNTESVKKDLVNDLKKISTSSSSTNDGGLSKGGNSLLNGSSSTIKISPGIGTLTFANSITYNKIKQQNGIKSPLGSPVATNGSAIILKRDRDNLSPLHQNITSINGNVMSPQVTKVLSRNIVQTANGFTPKSIASAQSPLAQNGNGGSPSSTTSSISAHSINYNNRSMTPISSTNGNYTTISTSSPVSTIGTIVKPLQQKVKVATVESEYPKPAYSYSCLIAMALKNSRSGSLPVSEIYSFMCEHFPYFKTAPSGWKNSVRHNLSLNKCFEKIEKPATNGNQRKGCLWAMNPERITKMDEEVQKWSRKDPMAIRNAMVYPEHLEALERGEMKHGSNGDSDIELDSQSEIEETSDLEEQELDDNIVDNMFVEEDIDEDDEEIIDGNSLLNNGSILLVNAAATDGGDSGRSSGTSIHDDGDDIGIFSHHHHHHHHHQSHHQNHQNHQRDFDIEVSLETHMIEKMATPTTTTTPSMSMIFDDEKVDDIYDAIDIEEDDKDAIQMAIQQQPDIIELSPADLNATQNGESDYQATKRARLNINYAIAPAGEFEKQIQIQKHHHQHQQQQQQQQQQTANIKQFKVQAIQQQKHQPTQHIVVQTITSGGATTTLQTAATSTHKFQQITGFSQQHNRRKMQLVNRIA